MRRLKLFFYSILGVGLIAGTIDLNNLPNYSGQTQPSYITKDNTTPGNSITDIKATIGRVLFYDKNLSANGTIACASCHQQQFAFSDTALVSVGLNGGFTGRHSMRVINARFGNEAKFFWDERALNLEHQSTQPIQDFTEMGFSGQSGQPAIDSLERTLSRLSYYKELFQCGFGDTMVTEARMKVCLAQFMRSIQSFDSKYDAGRALVTHDTVPFSNYTAQENLGKSIFMKPNHRPSAGGCAGCHIPPEFDIDPFTMTNGVVGVAGSTTAKDYTVTRAPTLRDVFNSSGMLNGPLMHDGSMKTFQAVMNHYNLPPVDPSNPMHDPRLKGPNANLGLTNAEKLAVEAFVKTLSGTNVYVEAIYSNPFDTAGNITIIPKVIVGEPTLSVLSIHAYPNPAVDYLHIRLTPGDYRLDFYDQSGRLVRRTTTRGRYRFNVSDMSAGYLIVVATDRTTGSSTTRKVMIR